jgi:hypothetical protein
LVRGYQDKSEVAPEPEKDESYCKFYCKYFDASGEIGCVGLKKERTKTELPLIESGEASNQALEFIQIDNKNKRINNSEGCNQRSTDWCCWGYSYRC